MTAFIFMRWKNRLLLSDYTNSPNLKNDSYTFKMTMCRSGHGTQTSLQSKYWNNIDNLSRLNKQK